MDRKFFLKRIRQKKDIHSEICTCIKYFDVNRNIFGVPDCLMEIRSGETETEQERDFVFFSHIDLLSAYS